MVDGAVGDVHIRCGGNTGVTRGGHNFHGASNHTGKDCRDEMALRVDSTGVGCSIKSDYRVINSIAPTIQRRGGEGHFSVCLNRGGFWQQKELF
jgi:hypothetical protein